MNSAAPRTSRAARVAAARRLRSAGVHVDDIAAELDVARSTVRGYLADASGKKEKERRADRAGGRAVGHARRRALTEEHLATIARLDAAALSATGKKAPTEVVASALELTPSRVRDLRSDPHGEKRAAARLRRAPSCTGCGNALHPDTVGGYCHNCVPRVVWTSARARAALREWVEEHGRFPRTPDFRGAGSTLPSRDTLSRLFGTVAAAFAECDAELPQGAAAGP